MNGLNSGQRKDRGSGGMIRLYRAPFPIRIRQVLFFRSKKDADAFREKLPEDGQIETTCPPDHGSWSRLLAQFFSQIDAVFFCVNEGDGDFSKFSNDAARSLLGHLWTEDGAPIRKRTVKVVGAPPSVDLAELAFDDMAERCRAAVDYEPPPEPESVDGQDGGAGSCENDARADGQNPAHLKRKKVARIKARRKWLESKEQKPFIFVRSWVNAAVMSGGLSIGELGAILICRSYLNSPYALECWPGEKKVAERTNSTRKTWVRNRDSLAKKGWIIVEKFGVMCDGRFKSGTSPIIYPVIPGRKCPSKFAPVESNLGQNDTG
ncbi:helix-turn-helix domain-containing protein [Desulfosarcina alkanivorans]|uniref:hypothetical protein n=1 Tax=Desulfosarcina alkanivorans TaxID=571177 RepID=UPI0012D30871|nr:hypothetical protein [Desulfosarcina alkanivorans]